MLQDEWGRKPHVELVAPDGAAFSVSLSPGSEPGTATFGLEDAEIPDGTVLRASWPEKVAITYGQDFRDVLSGEGVVQDGQISITLSHQSPFVLLESSVLGVKSFEWVPFAFPFRRDAYDFPRDGELLLMVPEGEYGVVCRDGAALRTVVASVNEPGVCARVSAPADWFSFASAVQAETVDTRNLSTGSGYQPGEYSGITPLADGRYALVHNSAKGGGIYLADIRFNGGRVASASIEAAPGTTESTLVRDPEGIAFVPRTGTLWVSGEKDQQILEYDLEGRPTGRSMRVPQGFAAADLATGNGFEALSYSAGTGRMWTVTEEPLKADADWFPAGENRRMLRLLAFDEPTCAPVLSRFYAMDAPTQSPASGDTYVHGVSDLLALDDGTLLVMEREVYVPAYKSGDRASMLSMLVSAVTQTKLYIVDTSGTEAILPKVLVKSFETRFPGALSLLMGSDPVLANFEGMCLGPVVDGHPTVLLVNDSEKGRGNSYARLQDYLKVIRF